MYFLTTIALFLVLTLLSNIFPLLTLCFAIYSLSVLKLILVFIRMFARIELVRGDRGDALGTRRRVPSHRVQELEHGVAEVAGSTRPRGHLNATLRGRGQGGRGHGCFVEVGFGAR